MKVSLIVVNHNCGDFLAENLVAVRSIATGIELECLLVDSHSSDDSIEQVKGSFPDITVIEMTENLGYATAVNRGLRDASGDVLVVMNGDIKPIDDSLSRFIRSIDANRNVTLFGAHLVTPSGTSVKTTARDLPVVDDILREGFFLPVRKSHTPQPIDKPGLTIVPAISGAVMGIHKENLKKLGPMCEEFFLYNEDMEWCRRAAELGMKTAVVTDAHFMHQGGASTRQNEGPAFTARLLADFQYFCVNGDTSPDLVKKRWLTRLRFRSMLYRLDTHLKILGGRPESRKRAAIYRLIADELKSFNWSTTKECQNAHPSRLLDMPGLHPLQQRDERPVILQIIPNMEYGGAQRLVEKIVKGPLSRKYRFEVLCLTHSGQIGDELIKSGVRVYVAGLNEWKSLAGWRRAGDYCALLDADLIHSHLIHGDIAALFGFRRGTPWISTKHSIDLWMSPFHRVAERFLLRQTKMILAVSDSAARAKCHLAKHGAFPLVVPSPPTVEVSNKPAPIFQPDKPVRLLVLGRLHAVKRIDLFLRVATILENRFPGHFSFRVVGEGPEEYALRALAEKLGVDQYVEFCGPSGNVARELDNSDFVLLFSEGEGLGLTVLETIARGRIPVIHRAGGAMEALPDMLDDCFVDSSSPEDYVGKILEICDDRERFIQLVECAERWVSSRKNYTTLMDKIYKNSLSTGNKNGKTRVLHLITRLIVGGAQENTIASVLRVEPGKYESSLWIGPQAGSEGSLLEDTRRQGIAVRVVPNLVREIHPWKDLVVTLQLAQLLRKERIDIVHTHSSKAGIVGRIAARIAGVPHITHTVHGWGFHEYMNPLIKRGYVVLEKLMLRWTKPLISVSNRTTRIGLGEGIGKPESYRLIRSGIPLSEFHPDRAKGMEIRQKLGIGKDEIVIGSVGRLSPQKNPHDFVQVASALSQSHPNTHFVYVGDGPLRNSVENAIKEAGLNDSLHLLGVRNDVPDILRAMDLFILTSLWEGLPRVIPQALATGVPVIAYDIAGIEESIIEEKNGHLVKPGDTSGMCRRLKYLIDNEPIRLAMSREAITGFDHSFSEDAMIHDLENCYDELVKE